MLNACIATQRSAASDADVTLQPRIPFDLPAVRGDGSKLQQALGNILSNAIKFSRKGGKVAIEAQRTNTDGVAISIRDSGVGMTEEEVAVALTPFGQVDGSRARWREGTGLGLPIAKALVELHGGTLEITSMKDHGTEVRVILPSRRAVSVAEARATVLGQAVTI